METSFGERAKLNSWIAKGLTLLAAAAFSCLCGWGFLHTFSFAFVLLGFPGGLAYFAISQTQAEDGAAKIALESLYLIVNTLFYYFLFRFVQKRITATLR